jgi:hypothetical protein
MKNAAKKIAALASVPEDAMLGALVTTNIDGDLAVPVVAVEAALASVGLTSRIAGATARSRFQETVGGDGRRVKGRKGPNKHRAIIGVEVDHADKGTLACEFRVNGTSNTAEKANLVPIGVVTFNEANSDTRWRFSCGLQEAGERMGDYIARALREVEHKGATFDDLRDFAAWAQAQATDIARFDKVSSHSASSVKRVLVEFFGDAGLIPVGVRGGSYFAVRDGGPLCAHARVTALATALGKETRDGVRMAYFPVPRVAEAVETATQMVRTSFLEEIGALEEEVANLKKHKEGQNEGRKTKLASLMDRIETYRAAWGFAGDDIEAAAQKVAEMIREHDTTGATKKAIKGKGNGEKTKPTSAVVVDAGAVAEAVAEAVADTTATAALVDALAAWWPAAESSLADSDEAETTLGTTTVTVEADPMFGFTYRVMRGGTIIVANAADTLEEARAAITAAL